MDKLKLQPEKFDLQKLVDENFKLLGSLHLKEVITVNKVEPQTFGFGDLNMVNLVLRNLILNGIKFTENGGSIELASRDGGNELIISVKDTGIGIKPEHQNRLFGVFQRIHSDKAYEGTGIGLAIVRKGIERMGGTVGVQSDGLTGSQFWIELPAAKYP